ncbi:uncharacterized protein Triagg1_4111 [Trichoderma aggressivum f. europaeum]|uniref:Uncharacterized protein n=1 Tax=Trichoderma aggressivum f. europaeum TaxID=173218 RepID=A0AAE1M6H7_9HYPO|nr:hypothetical protein Triagg1_4111 [Trichoderma aggressivum f. europaeum]
MMETINDEDSANPSVPNLVELMENIQSRAGYDSSSTDQEVAITEYTTDEEVSEEYVSDECHSEEYISEDEFSEEEIISRAPNAEGKRVASPSPLGHQPLDKRPRQSTAEEEFDIDKVVEAIEQNPLWTMDHKAALLEKYENSLRLLVDKVVVMQLEAREEAKKNEEFKGQMKKYREEEKKRQEEMKEYWEEDKKHREEEKKHWAEMRKFMVAISKAFGVAAQGENE